MQFYLGTILSITTGVLLTNTDPPIQDIYNILNFMTRDDLYTHQLPRVSEECRPYLLEQHPFLSEIIEQQLMSQIGVRRGHAVIEEVMALLVAKYGEFHEVHPIHAEDHEMMDPIEELKRMRPDLGDEHIIRVKPPQDDELSSTGNIDWK